MYVINSTDLAQGPRVHVAHVARNRRTASCSAKDFKWPIAFTFISSYVSVMSRWRRRRRPGSVLLEAASSQAGPTHSVAASSVPVAHGLALVGLQMLERGGGDWSELVDQSLNAPCVTKQRSKICFRFNTKQNRIHEA